LLRLDEKLSPRHDLQLKQLKWNPEYGEPIREPQCRLTALWLDEYSDIFGYQTNEQSDDIVVPESARRIQDSTSTASAAGRDEDLASRLAATNSKEELDQLIFGMSTGR